MGFLDDRITLSMDAYRRNNFDLIGNVVTMVWAVPWISRVTSRR